MIEVIASDLAAAIKANVPAVSKAGGIAQLITVTSADAVRRYPACAIDGGPAYTAMLPDSMESAVVFFQVVDTGYRETGTAGRVDMFAVLRLVLWVNGTKIYPAKVDAVMADILHQAHAFRYATSDAIAPKAVRILIENYEPKDKAVFNPYTFDESQTQFLQPPYDWRCARVRVLYSITGQCSPGWATAQHHC